LVHPAGFEPTAPGLGMSPTAWPNNGLSGVDDFGMTSRTNRCKVLRLKNIFNIGNRK